MTANLEAPSLASLRIDDQEREQAHLLLHIAVASPRDAEELARRIARPKDAIHEDIKSLMADGTVHLYQGTLRTSAASRLIVETPKSEIQEIHDQVLAEVSSARTVRSSTLVALVESGCVSETLLTHLVRFIGEHPNDASAMNALTQVARARNHGDDELLLLRANSAAIQGRPEQVLAFTDPLLTHSAPEVYRPASLLAAGAQLQVNRFERAEALYLHVDPKYVAHDAAWAVFATLGQGNLAQAEMWHATLGSSSLTSQAVGLSEFAEALTLSVQGSGEGALDLLARSVSTLTPLGADIFLPETPASLAAILAIGRGEPQTAQVFLERALKADLGGHAGRRRHNLLMAWALMAQGHVAAAEHTAGADGSPETLCDRDRFLYWCLQAGLARRNTDIMAMRQAWNEIRGQTFGMNITLYDLLPLGELMVTAARLRDFERAEDLVQDALELLSKLGNPAAWSAPLHWHGVQAAFQSGDTTALLPHANALVKASEISPYAATLAQAGNTWLEMLRGETNFASVEASARALASKGHVWDAARLAGQAALQHPERESALSMMQLAREIDKDHARQVRSTPRSSPLTARELEVARLVLDGQGYRAIGEQLFISPKTVEHHVARIRSRLGATSRGDLLARLHDEFVRLE